MRLTALNPQWINEGARRGVGVRFDHPHGNRRGTVGVLFANPIDGGQALPDDERYPANNSGHRWTRLGESFETLSLQPSIDEGPNGWHGYVTEGEVR